MNHLIDLVQTSTRKSVFVTSIIILFALAQQSCVKVAESPHWNTPLKNTVSRIALPSGELAYQEAGSGSKTLIFIHGNSASKDAFQKQMQTLSAKYKLYALDLPGHGMSENAQNPQETYSFKGHAEVIKAFMDAKGIQKAIIVGWSMGGHIAYELMAKYPERLLGVVTTGTPPVPHTNFMLGFHQFPEINLMGQGTPFTPQEAQTFTKVTGLPMTKSFVNTTRRTDPRTRHFMMKSVKHAVNAQDLVKTSNVPLAIIIGTHDTAVNGRYIKTQTYKNLVGGFCELNTGHAPFWEAPNAFNTCLVKFVDTITPDARIQKD